MGIRLASVTINSGDTTVTINSPSIDLTGAVQAGWELMIDGESLPMTIVSGGNNSLVIDAADSPATTLTARAAKIIETKGLLQQAATGLENARQELVTLKNSASQTATANSLVQRDENKRIKAAPASSGDDVVVKSQIGTAADKDVVSSATDTTNYRVLNVGAAGLLSLGTAPSIEEDNTLYPTMFGRDGDAGNGYPVFGFASTIITQRYNASRQSQLGIAHGGGVPRAAFRTMVSDNVWSGPFDFYGEHNLNHLEFGGVSARMIGIGYATSATQATVYLPINSTSIPTGISIPAGSSFEIRSPAGGIIDQTLTESDISYNSVSGERLLRLIVNATGMTTGQVVELRAMDTTSKISGVFS